MIKNSNDPAAKSTRLIFLIVFFGILVAIVAGSSGAPSQQKPGTPTTSLLDYAPWIVGILLIFVAAYLLIGTQRNSWLQSYNEAMALLAEERLTDALERFERLEEMESAQNLARKLILHGLGFTHLHMNHIAEGVRFLEKSHGIEDRDALILKGKGDIDKMVSADLMLAHLIQGRPELAQRVRNEQDEGEEVALVFLLPDAITLCQQGKYSEAEDSISALWNKAAARWNKSTVARLRIVRAFALRNMPASPERELLIKNLVAGTKPCQAGKFDYLCGRWPELKTFLVAEGLSS